MGRTWKELFDQFGRRLDNMTQPDRSAFEEAGRRLDSIAKPLDGLGRFEETIKRLAGIGGSADIAIAKRAVVIMCADNGIVCEGVSQSGSEVTSIVAKNMADGTANVCQMARMANVKVIPVNIGIREEITAPGLIDARIAAGTADFLKEPAMTEETLFQAVNAGIDIVCRLKKEGYQILATGEMGIGNTTTSSALASALLGVPAEDVTGRGAGLSDEGLKRKREVINEAVQKYDLRNQDAWEVLRCVGGLDIAGLVGVFLGGALYQIPIVIDGLICAAAALVAERIAPECRQYLFASHRGKEPACSLILEELGLRAVIDADMALGEGTGAVMLFPLLDMALSVYNANRTFHDIHVPQYKRYR